MKVQTRLQARTVTLIGAVVRIKKKVIRENWGFSLRHLGMHLNKQ